MQSSESTEYFLPWKSIQKFLWGLAPGVLLCALSALYDYMQTGGENITAQGLGVALLTGAVLGLRNAFMHFDKPSLPKGPPIGLWLCILGVAATFPGCLSLAPYSPGALSSNAVTVSESTATEYGVDRFDLTIRSRGDAAAKTSVRYTGETPTTPWDFRVQGEANVESAARVLPLNEGAGEALASLPQAIAPLVQAFNAAPPGEAGQSLRETILREIVQRVLARVSGGVVAP